MELAKHYPNEVDSPGIVFECGEVMVDTCMILTHKGGVPESEGQRASVMLEMEDRQQDDEEEKEEREDQNEQKQGEEEERGEEEGKSKFFWNHHADTIYGDLNSKVVVNKNMKHIEELQQQGISNCINDDDHI